MTQLADVGSGTAQKPRRCRRRMGLPIPPSPRWRSSPAERAMTRRSPCVSATPSHSKCCTVLKDASASERGCLRRRKDLVIAQSKVKTQKPTSETESPGQRPPDLVFDLWFWFVNLTTWVQITPNQRPTTRASFGARVLGLPLFRVGP